MNLKKQTIGFCFILPGLCVFCLFTIYPIVYSLFLSFHQRQGQVYVFAGLENFKKLFADPLFFVSVSNTFQILFIHVPLMLGLALLLAVILNSPSLKLRSFLRLSFFLPVITLLVASALVFRIIFNYDYGVVNYLLISLGGEKIKWFYHRYWAKAVLVIAVTWRWTGYNMVFMLAGLQLISKEIYDAASIDGAGKLQQFSKITLPLMKPIILFCLVTSTIGTFILFDEPYILTGGGPANATLTMTLYLYRIGFQHFQFGYACAIAFSVVIIVAALSLLEIKFLGEER